MKPYVTAIIASLLLVTGWVWTGRGQESEDDASGNAPEAQATKRRENLDQRREERRALQLDPQARETARALRREEMHDVEQAVEVRDPIPLPVEIQNPGALVVPGKPAGGACPGLDICTLRAAPSMREVLVVTAVWSATKVHCDDVTAATPANGAVVAPWWRCQREFLVEGPGAGYAGFIVVVQ